MGILSGTKKAVGQLVNFKVGDWLNAAYHKQVINYLTDYSKSLFKPEKTEGIQETFEEAVLRLNLTEKDLAARKKEFSNLFFIFLLISISFFAYTMFITVQYKNVYGFILGIGITALALTKTFRYHFWLTQINKRKLGLNFKEWLN